MKRGQQTRQNGFTLVEVVLVLAIAGLLFLIVFVALTTAARTQRDYQRKSDLGKVYAQIQAWRAAHGAQNLDTQAEVDNFVAEHMADIRDPRSGEVYEFRFFESSVPHGDVAAGDFAVGYMDYIPAHICGSDSGEVTHITSESGAPHDIRQFALLTKFETGDVYCLDMR